MKKYFLLVMTLTSIISMAQVIESGNKNTTVIPREEITGHSPRAYTLMESTSSRRISYIKQSDSTIPSDQVEIILEAHKVFGDFAKIGFQLLLDADHSVYGDIIHDWSQAFYETYSDFEYRIPEDADADENSKNVVMDGEESILIPAGVYDFMVIYPYPGDGLMLAKGDFSRGDDFRFQGGCSYRFLIEYGAFEMPDYSGYDAVSELYAKTDVSITDIILPIKGMDFTDEEEVTIEIVNRGQDEVKNLIVGYQIDDNPIVMERTTFTITSGDTVQYTFKNKVDFSVEKLYEIKAWSVLNKDMITTNDTCIAKCNHQGVTQLPYVCDFSTQGADAFIYDWTIVDINNDNSTWMYSEWVKGVGGTYGVASCSSGFKEGNDILYSVPLYVNAGDNHMILYTSCVNDIKTELLDIAYGMTMNYEEMTPLAQYEVSTTEWVKRIINFNVPQSGVYYFAFKAHTVDGYNQFIDDITIAEGYHEVTPQLRIDKIILPYSNCDLSENSKIGAMITNIGTCATDEFTLRYTVDYEPSVTQTFADVLEPTKTGIYYFDTTADLSEIGKYEVLMEATCNTEIESEMLSEVHHYAPITELPVTTNFRTGENYASYWTEMNPGTWLLDEFGSFNTGYHELENGLLSHCFALDRSVRIRLQYAKGGWETGRMYIACGKAGVDVSTYRKVYEDNDISQAMEVEFDVIIDEPDNYSFVIVNMSDEYVSLELGELTISEYLPYDLRLLDVRSPLTTYTPQVQFSDEMTLHAVVVNRGAETMPDVRASLYMGNDLLATSSKGLDIASNDTIEVPVTVQFPTPAIGDLFNLTLHVNGTVNDDYDDDNRYVMSTIEVTDTIYANENNASATSGLGMMGDQLFIGNIYELAVADALTSVSVAWANVQDPTDPVVVMPVALAIYEVNDDMTVGRQLYFNESQRGMGGWQNYDFAPMQLNPGRYYFEVQQLGIYNMGIGSVSSNSKCCYQNVEGTLRQVPGGTLMIRANFANDAVIYNNDAGVVEFIYPRKKATLYSSDETIVVSVRNFGTTQADLPVTCKVNNDIYTQQLSLMPLEQVNVEFKHIDLTKVGSYEITIQTMLNGDENAANDVLRETLYAVEDANPYVMNFEHCYDFDAAPDQFNPRWRTVDRTGQPTDYYWEYEHPYQGEPVGFMVFNTDATVPVATNRLLGFYPHSGEKFGAAFCVGYWSTENFSDSWLISPQLALSTHSSLELYVKTRYIEPDGEKEAYSILISDTDDNFDSFKVVGDSIRRAAQEEWEHVVVDLSEYDNKEVYIAIRYIGERLKNVCLMVDDIMVKGDGINTDGVTATNNDNAQVHYNAAEEMITVTASDMVKIELFDTQGRITQAASTLGLTQYRMSLASIPSGIYIVRVTTIAGVHTCKIAVK